MKSIKKSYMAAAAIATVGSVGVLGIGAAHAANNNSSDDPTSSLVDKLTSKFNLNKADVQKVFDENRSEMESKREAKMSERLQTLVDEGTITADQKTKIEAKLQELKAEFENNKDSLKDLSRDERKARMDEKKSELEAWAKDNGLDLSKLKGIFMGGGHRGPGGPPPSENN